MLLVPVFAQRPSFRPSIPTADRSKGNRIFLERADSLFKTPMDSFMVLVGNVMFTKGGMKMYCDSAHYQDSPEMMEAFGHVKMEQGDTLFVYADELLYQGITQQARLFGDYNRPVRMINRDVKLETDEFIYDLAINLGFYESGGKLTDASNTLTSLRGEYNPDTKEANFYDDVHLHSNNTKDTLDIYTNSLYYNTLTHLAELAQESTIVNWRGTIYTTSGVYQTDSDKMSLYERSLIVTKDGQTLTADTIIYDRAQGYGEAMGAMVMTDSVHQVTLEGNYGFYDEKKDSSFVSGRPRLMSYSQPDTLYLHGRYISTTRLIDSVEVAGDSLREAYVRIDTTHAAVIYPRVRFYRADMQGVCDSLRFTESDSTIRMFRHPIVWNEDQQISGKIIELQLNDSTIREAHLPDLGFATQHIEGDHYNQLSGKSMHAYFDGGELKRLQLDGSVEIVMYPEENDSTINKIVNAQSSFLTAWFKGRTTERIKMWPETTGTVTPMYLAKPSLYFLPKFKWYDGIRPTSPDSIFVIPKAMEELMLTAE